MYKNLIIAFFVAALVSCREKQDSNVELVNKFLKPSKMAGKVSSVYREGGSFDTVFIFRIQHDEQFKKEDLNSIFANKVKDTSHKKLIEDGISEYYPEYIRSNNNTFYEGTANTSLWIRVVSDGKAAYFIGDRF